MSKRNVFQDYIEYFSLKAVMFFLYLFSLSFAQKIGQIFASFAYFFVPMRKKHVIDMLTFAFPEKSKKEIRTIAKNTYKSFMKTIIEMIFFPVLSDKAIENMMVYENEEVINDALGRNKGMIFMSAHFGNWELTALSFSKSHPMSVIVAKQSNPLVDKMINDIRTKRGFKTINKDDKMAFRNVIKALRAKETVAILADQDAGKQGVFVPFFGKLASTPKGPALFAIKAGCPIVTAFGIRQPDGKIKVRFKEIPFYDTKDEEENIRLINAQYSRLLEEVIREYPDHWFWFHRKWKTMPPSNLS
ncbi:MAG: lysophospholipid acyltransferase family protein [Endomicrobium sp.]|jgi:KDO2-lipid IV(A) lauroyltransferase|nr:lysophospholipid acyltransferase family protein [Endomicrobium sp.]